MTTEILVVNLNNLDTPPLTLWSIFNYILISLTIITASLALGQFLLKLNKKAKRSTLTGYGLKAEMKNKKPNQISVCKCRHKYKIHTSGLPQVISALFPKIKYSHVCGGVMIVCLIRRCCNSELILPKEKFTLITNGSTQLHQIGFNGIPIFHETQNFLWDKGYTQNLINI